MKRLIYSVEINRPVELVFSKMLDKSVYRRWAAAWGEGMTFEGEWKQGANISFFDQSQGGTKVIIEEFIPNELIKARHIAMVNAENIEQELSDEMMRKWIGSEENYYFKSGGDSKTTLEIEIVTDEAFEEMMGAWPEALRLLKEICEE